METPIRQNIGIFRDMLEHEDTGPEMLDMLKVIVGKH
jgi:hypothetical protein